MFNYKGKDNQSGGAPKWRRPKDHFEKTNDDGFYSMYENRILQTARIPTKFIESFEGDMSMGEVIRIRRGREDQFAGY